MRFGEMPPRQRFGVGPSRVLWYRYEMRLTTPGRGVTYSFGRFLLDPAKRTLTRDGDAVPLGAKAFDLLHYLVREDGRVVSKTEILDNVWPGTFVEEGNIFQTISVLRKALDPFFDGESPIATVARQGYRFAAAVERREVKSVLTQVDDGVVAAPSAAEQPVQAEPAQPAAVPLSAPATARRWWWGAGIAALLLAAVGIAVSMRPGPPKPVAPVAPRRSVAVLPFQNLSGKPDAAWFSTALAETLGSQLAAGDRLRAIGGDQVARSVRELSLPAGTGLGPGQISDVRSNLGCDLVLTGSYLLWNGKLRVDLQAFDAQTGETAGMLTGTDDARNLIPLVEKLGSQMSAKLGAGTPAERRRIASAISSNPQAAMLYFRGLTANRVADVPAAKAYFQEALKADPKFALAHSALASALLGGGYEQQAADEAKKALDSSKGLTGEARLQVEAYYAMATHQNDRAIAAWRELWRRYPDNLDYILSVGQAEFTAAKGDEVLAAVAEARKLPPPAGNDPRIDRLEAIGAQLAGRYDQANAAIERAIASANRAKVYLELARATINRGVIRERRNDNPGAMKDYADAKELFEKYGDPQGLADSMRLHGALLQRGGDLDGGEHELKQGLELSRRIGYNKLSGRILSQLGLLYQREERLSDAAQVLREAASDAHSTNDKGGQAIADLTLGYVLIDGGDLAGAETVFAEANGILKDLKDPLGQASSMNSLATVNLARGRLDAAAAEVNDAVAGFRKLNAKRPLGDTLTNAGWLAMLRGDGDGAVKAFSESCALLETQKNAVQTANCHLHLALAEYGAGHKKDAMAAIAKLTTGPNRSIISAHDWARIAGVQIDAGELGRAADSIAEGKKSDQFKNDLPDPTIALQIAAARLDAARGKHIAAVDELQQARVRAERYGYDPLAQEARTALERQK